MKRVIALCVLAATITGAYLAFKLLPWWALVLGFIALVVVGKFVVGRLVQKLLTLPFKAKGAVLRGAVARINSVTPVERTGSDDAERFCYEIDVTITPGDVQGNFNHWEPGELRLVRSDSQLDLDSSSDDDGCEIQKVAVEEDGQFKDDEGHKYSGARRLKLRVAVTPSTTVLKFRYYFEEFGQIRFDHQVAQAA